MRKRGETDWSEVSKECFEAVIKKTINVLEKDINAAHDGYRTIKKDYVRKDTIKYIAAVLLFIIAAIGLFIRL